MDSGMIKVWDVTPLKGRHIASASEIANINVLIRNLYIDNKITKLQRRDELWRFCGNLPLVFQRKRIYEKRLVKFLKINKVTTIFL